MAHALKHLTSSWSSWIHNGSGEPAAASSRSFHSSLPDVLRSERAAKEAAESVEDFSRRLCQRSLAPTLVGKLEEMCTFISEREYAQANKVYMDLAIGTKRWLTDMPVSVSFSMSRQDTDIKWTPNCGANPIDEAGLRSHVVVLRRLLTVAQALQPNENPSKNLG